MRLLIPLAEVLIPESPVINILRNADRRAFGWVSRKVIEVNGFAFPVETILVRSANDGDFPPVVRLRKNVTILVVTAPRADCCAPAEDETIYGDFAIVPLLSLLSNRRIAANEIDSSIMRFTSGTSNLNEVIASIEDDDVRLIVARPHRGIAVYPLFRAYLEEHYAPINRFNEGTRKEIRLWRQR